MVMQPYNLQAFLCSFLAHSSLAHGRDHSLASAAPFRKELAPRFSTGVSAVLHCSAQNRPALSCCLLSFLVYVTQPIGLQYSLDQFYVYKFSSAKK